MDYIILILVVISCVFSLLAYFSSRKANSNVLNIRSDISEDQMIKETKLAIREMEQTLAKVEEDQQEMSRKHAQALSELSNQLISEKLNSMNSSFSELIKSDKAINKELLEGNSNTLKSGLEVLIKTTETRLAALTSAITNNFTEMRKENNTQIEAIRQTMSERLDKTLNDQFEKSFRNVITQMGDLQKSMGELKGISTQVGSLEKTLNGVKTRGIMGEIQLKQIIADILTPSQYEIEVPTKPDSSDHVEIAIKLPDRGSDRFTYLPIDSKCHLDIYEKLLDAYDSGDQVQIKSCKKAFKDAIKADASQIKEKYISTPNTTPYAILFVPFEGMYSEIVNLDLVEELNKMQITVAGPYTLTAILCTVTNYFQSLAIEKKSAEIETTLGNVKKAFSKFDDALNTVQRNLDTASRNLNTLQTTRVNAINRALRGITEIDDGDDLLSLDSN
ncbi:MAG: DNA recombination protein RmuC [Clostridiales bacterium]|nr:DNA recombination protein RmuC [Clostridiales bacterium]